MNINTVDLNLFSVFSAVYSTRSTTLAAAKIGITQSGVSNALKRMRDRFNDPLFIRTPDGMTPTPLAERLIGPIDQGLAQVSRSLEEARPFDPGTSGRRFRIAMTDIGRMVLLPSILAASLKAAPGVRFETLDMSYSEARQQMIHGQLDLAIGSWPAMGQSFVRQRLFDETFVVLLRRDHPITPGALTMSAFLEASHIQYRPNGTSDGELKQAALNTNVFGRGNVVLTASNALGLSAMLAGSDLLMTAPRGMAHAMMSTRTDLRTEPIPFPAMPVQICQQWHERFNLDSGNRWLRELMLELFYRPMTGQPFRPAPEQSGVGVAVGLPVTLKR